MERLKAIAFRKQGLPETALDCIHSAKQLYLTAQAPPYDYANLLCEQAAILEMIHKDDMCESVEEDIAQLWKHGAQQIVLSKEYQTPTVVCVIHARHAMFCMKAWAGVPQSELVQPKAQDLRKAEKCLQQCSEIKTGQYQPSVYKVTLNVAYSYLRLWQGNITEAYAYTKAAMRHYKDCQHSNKHTEKVLDERLQWLQSLLPNHESYSEYDLLVEVLH